MPKGSGTIAATSQNDPVSDSLRIDTIFTRIVECQAAFASQPADRQVQRNFFTESHDSVAACFYVVGTGMKSQDSLEALSEAAGKIAAKFDGEKRALFLKACLIGEKVVFGTTVKGKVLYLKELRQRTSGDMVFVLYMVPVGSVVVR